MTKPEPKKGFSIDNPGTYRIRIKGFLDKKRSDWLGGMQITTQSESERTTVTTLVGELSDQAASCPGF